MDTNDKLQEIAKTALDNWFFDEETDPDGDCKRGLEYLASDGNFDQEIIDARFLGATDDSQWSILDEWARYYGHIENSQ